MARRAMMKLLLLELLIVPGRMYWASRRTAGLPARVPSWRGEQLEALGRGPLVKGLLGLGLQGGPPCPGPCFAR